MKIFFVAFSLMSSLTYAGLENCLRDSKTHGNHLSPHSPSEECVQIIRNHPENIKLKTTDGKYNLFGLSDMLYVEANGSRTLLSGDQTQLNEILKIEVCEIKKRLIVVQENSVSQFNLDFIGNVSPLSYFKSPILKNASRVKLLSNEDMLAVFTPAKIRLVNSNAESRHDSERTKPKLLNEISGENSQLQNPSDIIFIKEVGKFLVLDSNRVLVFTSNVKKNQAPLKIILLQDARSLLEMNGQIYYVNSKGQQTAFTYAD